MVHLSRAMLIVVCCIMVCASSLWPSDPRNSYCSLLSSLCIKGARDICHLGLQAVPYITPQRVAFCSFVTIDPIYNWYQSIKVHQLKNAFSTNANDIVQLTAIDPDRLNARDGEFLCHALQQLCDVIQKAYRQQQMPLQQHQHNFLHQIMPGYFPGDASPSGETYETIASDIDFVLEWISDYKEKLPEAVCKPLGYNNTSTIGTLESELHRIYSIVTQDTSNLHHQEDDRAPCSCWHVLSHVCQDSYRSLYNYTHGYVTGARVIKGMLAAFMLHG